MHGTMHLPQREPEAGTRQRHELRREHEGLETKRKDVKPDGCSLSLTKHRCREGFPRQEKHYLAERRNTQKSTRSRTLAASRQKIAPTCRNQATSAKLCADDTTPLQWLDGADPDLVQNCVPRDLMLPAPQDPMPARTAAVLRATRECRSRTRRRTRCQLAAGRRPATA